MGEGSDFHDFMALASRDDKTKLKEFVKDKNWQLKITFDTSLDKRIKEKVKK